MVSVEFRRIGPGTCAWCRKEREEVATVAFSDKSFVGAMCWKDLQRALGMKVGPANGEPARGAVAVPVAAPSNDGPAAK